MNSPVESRRSRKIAPVGQADEEIVAEDLCDLEDERLRSRQQAENEFQSFTTSDKRLSVSEKSVSEHFQSCIQLAAENKINPKNAFSFKLIDLLHSMFSKKKPIKDFTEVSSSLDAGVKIYSCRVDNVHSDTLKMATTVCSTNKARNEDGLEDDEQETGAGEMKKKKTIRKTKKTTIALAKEIDRPKANENENRPCSILTNDNFVTSSAIFDGNKVCWHLNTLRNFCQSEKPARFSQNNISVDFPTVSDNAIISSTFKNFKFGEDGTFVELPKKETMSTAFEVDFASNNDGMFDEDMGLHDDIFEPSEHEFAESRNHVECLSKMMSSSDFVLEISKLITSEKSDYRYFNFQQLQKKFTSRNTQHWAPLMKKSAVMEKRTKEVKQEPIDFENNDEDLEIFEKKTNAACILNTITSREKFLITPVTNFSVNKFFKLNVWRDMFVIPNSNSTDETPSDLEEMIKDYDYNNPNDSQNCIPEHYEDDYRDEEENIPSDVHEVMEKTMFLKDNLIEIPNKVSKIQLPYTMKDKSVNMKDLKLKIWKRIESPEIKMVEHESENERITFLNICQTVLYENTDNSKKDLSIPIVFNAILQLANDKNLALFNPRNDQSNFVVAIDINTS